MDLKFVKPALLRYLNDKIEAYSFDGQIIVDLPFWFSDGDSISLVVSAFEGGKVKVSDAGNTALKLRMTDLDLTSGAVADFWKSVVSDFAERNLDPVGEEIAVVAEREELAAAMMDVVFNCIHAEQARHFAAAPRAASFSERVGDRITGFIRTRHYDNAVWQPNASLSSASGRRRQVTGLFKAEDNDPNPLIVQAVGSKSSDSRSEPVDRAFTIFSNLEAARSNKLVVVNGTEGSWDPGMIGELKSVANLAFFDEPKQVEEALLDHLQRGFQPA